jgi:DNA-binding NarL/FixJ family response regulator
VEKTVLVIDDHPLFRKALVGLVLETQACQNVIGAASAEEGLQRLRDGSVELVLLDLGLPGASGVDAISLFRQASGAKVLVVSASENRQEIAAATRAGACAVVSKSVSMETLKDVVRRVLVGALPEQKWIRPAGALSLEDENGRGLTLLMNGHSNKEIGIRLGLAEITVKTHLTAIFRMLGVVNRTQAVVAIRRLGIDYGSEGNSAVRMRAH